MENGRNLRSSRIRTENGGSVKSVKLYLPLSRSDHREISLMHDQKVMFKSFLYVFPRRQMQTIRSMTRFYGNANVEVLLLNSYAFTTVFSLTVEKIFQI